MDDELNVLPISSHIRSITAVPVKEVIYGRIVLVVDYDETFLVS